MLLFLRICFCVYTWRLLKFLFDLVLVLIISQNGCGLQEKVNVGYGLFYKNGVL